MLKFHPTTYAQEIEIFLDYMRGKLERAWEEENKGNSDPIQELYQSSFKIIFEGATLELDFGACEFQSLEECLEAILEDNQ